MTDNVFRIHPAIGFARVGTSNEYYLAPETFAGHPLDDGGPMTGGLPIRKGTESETIKASELRDASQALKRQAARFRIFGYTSQAQEAYPMQQPGEEIQIGSTVIVDGATKTVADIIWTVHMANKKTTWYEAADDEGIVAWLNGSRPPLRNDPNAKCDIDDPAARKRCEKERTELQKVVPPISSDPDDKGRLARLVTDPGPRAIRGSATGTLGIDIESPASCWQSGDSITTLENYPKTFPENGFSELHPPGVERITTLGDLETDEHGRLIVAGAYGRANSFSQTGPEYGFTDSVNNNFWFDDTGDGPVTAVLVFDDGSTHEVEGDAWVISTDPSYAPQILNAVSLWDEIHDSFVRKLSLRPALFNVSKAAFVQDYEPSFVDEVQPIFLAAGLQRWVTNLSVKGISAHQRVEQIAGKDEPASTQLHGLGFIREPVDPENLDEGPPLSGDDLRMPLSLGDSGRSLMSLSQTQYFYLQRWDAGATVNKDNRIELNSGEKLDKAALVAGLGGRFSPGIDMTYICREPDLYVQDWQRSGTGPFRIHRKRLSYQDGGTAPFLSLGWIPRNAAVNAGLEPGDVSKFMAIPWHADYNSCATHLPAPNPEFGNTLYWSWPAQRPVAVHAAADVIKNNGKVGDTGDMRFSVRGDGTNTRVPPTSKKPAFGPPDPSEVGRYQEAATPTEPGIIRILDHWAEIGTVIQATNIDKVDGNEAPKLDSGYYLEVESRLDDRPSDPVLPWPNTVKPGSS